MSPKNMRAYFTSHSRNGIGTIVVLIALAALVLILGGGWYLRETGFFFPIAPGQKVCIQEVKLCPDGKTSVSRTGPNCTFALCPSEASCQGGECLSQSQKIYDNKEMGIKFSYPNDWKINGGITGDIIKDGKVYTSFHDAILPPDWGTREASYNAIEISHTWLNYDNVGREKQWAAVKCPKANYVEQTMEGPVNVECFEYTNERGIIMARMNYGSNSFIALIPTGKYILSISIGVEDKEKDKAAIAVYDHILDSLVLAFQSDISTWRTYRSQGECESATGQTCWFQMCDIGNCPADSTGWVSRY